MRSDNEQVDCAVLELRASMEKVFKLMSDHDERTTTTAAWQDQDRLRAPLEKGLGTGDIDLAELLLAAGTEADALVHEVLRDDHRNKRLGDRFLLQGDAVSPTKKNETGNAPIHLATIAGYENIVSLLLRRGASLTEKGAIGDVPLQLAAFHGHEKVVRVLAQRGAELAGASYAQGREPLQLAIGQGHVAAISALLAAGADVNAGFTSCWGGSCSVFPLHVAALVEQTDALRALIQHGADVKAVDGFGYTALHHAVLNSGAIDALVEAGADVDAQDSSGRTPLQYAFERPVMVTSGILALLKRGANVNVQSPEVDSPLQLAIMSCPTSSRQHQDDVGGGGGGCALVELVDLLLRWGADETAVGTHGSAMEIARADAFCGGESWDRVIQLLECAPADRAWRRRGFWVLGRARAANNAGGGGGVRVKKKPLSITGDVVVDSVMTRRRALGCEGDDDNDEEDLAGVAVRVLELDEEELFRYIVSFL